MICKTCSHNNEDNCLFCVKCGTKLEAEPVNEAEPTPVQTQAEQPIQPQVQPQPIQRQQQPPLQQTTPNQYQNQYSNPKTQEIPYNYTPLSPWAYFGYQLLFAIPIVGFILLIVFSFSNDNINRRNFARSYWCAWLIILIIGVVVGIFAFLIMMSAMM